MVIATGSAEAIAAHVSPDFVNEHTSALGASCSVLQLTARWQGEHPISVRGVQRLVVDDGLITHRTDCWDSAVFLTQTSEEARTALTPFGITPDSA